MVEEIQRQLQDELDNYNALAKELSKTINDRRASDAILNENKGVKTELELLNDDAEVYKQFGPVLVKMSLAESKQNVNTRIDFISKKVKEAEELIAQLEEKQDAQRETLQKLQNKFQQAQIKNATKA